MAKSKITTVEEALAAVKWNGGALKNVPEELKTAEVCLEAVKKDADALAFVPENLKTAEICLEAIKKDADALPYVPWGQLNLTDPAKASPKEFNAACFKAMKHDIVAFRYIQYVPEKFIMESFKEYHAICLKEMKRHGSNFQYLPKNLMTEEICLAAVYNDNRMLPDLPENIKTPEFCLKLMKQNGKALEYVPEKLRTTELCLVAVKENGMAIKYVPKKLRTAEMCLKAVENNYSAKWYGSALKYVPENLKTAKLCFEAVKKGGGALEYVPENLRTAELCFEAVKHDSQMAVFYVPANLKTIEYCLAAVCGYTGWTASYRSAVGDPFSVVPKELEDEVRRRLEELKSPEFCLEAVKRDGRALAYSLYYHHTAEFCLEAVRRNRSALEHVPEALREEVRHRANMTAVNIRALTQEGICFEFDKLKEKKSDFVTNKIDVYVTVPDHREVPKNITLKFTNVGTSAEQKEVNIDCEGRVSKGELEGIAILHAAEGKPRPGYKYRQKAEITLNFENRSETLVCPISRTTTFSMCFYEAYEAQKGKPASVGSVNEFSN